jgi:hypothetical protein
MLMRYHGGLGVGHSRAYQQASSELDQQSGLDDSALEIPADDEDASLASAVLDEQVMPPMEVSSSDEEPEETRSDVSLDWSDDEEDDDIEDDDIEDDDIEDNDIEDEELYG